MDKKKLITAIVAIILAVLAVHSFRQKYPEITWPVINSYSKDPDAPSSNGSPYKFYYEELTSVEKQAYNMILDDIYDMPEKILVPDLTEEELDNVFRALLYDNPDLFFVGRKCSVQAELWNDFFTVDYIMTREEYEKQKEELDTVCNQIVAFIDSSESDYQKELTIHDYIVNHCTYKLEENNYVYSSAYGALVNGVAACEGYSKAAKLLFDKVGIESALITGTVKATGSNEGGSHMWNIVKIDGSYYHLDCTWDDPISNKGNAIKMYTYFNLDDATIRKTHSDFSIDLGCTSTSAGYYEQNNLTFPDYDKNSEDAVGAAIYKQYKSGERNIQLNFVTGDSYNAAHKDLIDDGRLLVILKKVNSTVKLASKLTGYYENEDTYTLTLVFE